MRRGACRPCKNGKCVEPLRNGNCIPDFAFTAATSAAVTVPLAFKSLRKLPTAFKARRGKQVTDSDNFRSDLDLNGVVDDSDVARAKARSGKSAP